MKRGASWKFFSLIVMFGVVLSPLLIAGIGHSLKARFVLANERALRGVAEIHLRLKQNEPGMSIAWTKSFTAKYDFFHYDVWVVDETGQVIDANMEEKLPYDWKMVKRPSSAGEIIVAPELNTSKYAVSVFKPTSLPEYWIARYDRFNSGLVFTVLLLPFFGISLLALASLGAAGIILLYLRKKATVARQVMIDLKEGKLASRFRVGPWDEAGELMVAFNEMASHVEHLVHKLRQTERTRTTLLRELSHDLRTPLFSARTMIEALTNFSQTLSEEERKQCLKQAYEEMLYIQSLVEDLFFLAEMDEPGYRTGSDLFDLRSLIENEIENRKAQNTGKKWTFQCDSKEEYRLVGDPNSMIRLLKNAFDNAHRYSKKEIRIKLETAQGEIRLKVRDDGPGVSQSVRREFGMRRSQSLVSGSIMKRDSLRLGSVIMRTVAEIHQGRVYLRNWKIPSTGKRGGAQITFVFPQAAVALQKAA